MIRKKSSAGFGKYILTFVFAMLMLLCFGPKQAQAAITKEITQDGFKLSGSGTLDLQSENKFKYYVGYQIPSGEAMDYQVDATITFSRDDLSLHWVSLWLDDNSTYLYPNGNNIAQGSESFNESGKLEFMEIGLIYDGYVPEQYVDFNITVNVRENRKNAEIKIYPPETNYDKTTGMFLITVDDPYVFDSNKDPSKYSVSISDPSVATVTGITPSSNDSFEVSVYFLKAGSADLVFNYGKQTQKASFTVQKTIITVSSSISLRVGDTTMFSSYVFKTGGGDITIKKVKSSNKKIVDAAGGFIIAKKPGTAKVSALVNGKRRVITVIVNKKPAPKPKLKQLQVKVLGYKYYPDTGKTYYKTKFTNKSKTTITKVKLRFTMTINEEMTRTKTFKVNIKPGKTRTMNLDIGKLISNPSNIKVKCLRFWYKK